MPKIKIHYSLVFFILISFLTGSMVQILGILFTIVFHEFCHLLTLMLFNKKVVSLEISLIGGMIKTDKHNLSLIKKLIINLSGIFGNILLIMILINLKKAFPEQMKFLISYNLLMIVFNLIPIIPLDGYQIINDILLEIYEEEYTFIVIKSIDIISLIVLLLFIIYLKKYGLILIWFYLLYNLFKYNIDYKILKKYLLFYKK